MHDALMSCDWPEPRHAWYSGLGPTIQGVPWCHVADLSPILHGTLVSCDWPESATMHDILVSCDRPESPTMPDSLVPRDLPEPHHAWYPVVT
jgi:hypothetical protein